MEVCQGPCLTHCYNKNIMFFSMISFILGILISNYYLQNNNKKHEN